MDFSRWKGILPRLCRCLPFGSIVLDKQPTWHNIHTFLTAYAAIPRVILVDFFTALQTTKDCRRVREDILRTKEKR